MQLVATRIIQNTEQRASGAPPSTAVARGAETRVGQEAKAAAAATFGSLIAPLLIFLGVLIFVRSDDRFMPSNSSKPEEDDFGGYGCDNGLDGRQAKADDFMAWMSEMMTGPG
eukprot:scaffold47225_cov46-Prasinocladus_malaysianus.AAC.1